ncbi:hypothetical protein R2601_04328 [Salipiger bermudensis HTCC2601]|uniref:Uncharacterized protein n=1 Tax=Salipiger bermudensis (strain DSM 26914 / JCM 13377 / KCTC 12554 / HTCC2601) TaxID=314265 RepID=Q0FVY0_SALBH|nr:hypothetical protein R2601_04328 [Salipiger bermudensis HTCC2601]
MRAVADRFGGTGVGQGPARAR